jgi:hypothetical protein
LNRQLWDGTVAEKSFYEHLRLRGCDYQRSILVNVFPCDRRCLCGVILTQDRIVLEFSVDLDDKTSEWEDVTSQFTEEGRRFKRRKPWTPQVLAFELLEERRRQQDAALS